MEKVLGASRYLVLVGVVALLAAAVGGFVLGAIETVKTLSGLLAVDGKEGSISLIKLADIFLIATALLVFAIGLYSLFIKEIVTGGWLSIHDLHDLKSKLSSLLVLFMAIAFVEHYIDWKDGVETLYFGVAAAVVSAALIAYGHYGGKD